MPDINITFSRRLLTQLAADFKARRITIERGTGAPRLPVRVMGDAWVFCCIGTWVFHGPGGFYWYGNADNAYDARYQGWHAWARAQGYEL